MEALERDGVTGHAGPDEHTRLYLIFGDPIDHVHAPVVWNRLFQRNAVNAAFLPAHTTPAHFDAAVAGAQRLANVDGLMFTMPFKGAALRHCSRLTQRAERVGSINLMRPEADGSWTGDNVDGAGFVAGLGADGIALSGRHVYLHGCGGVGQNLAWTLSSEPIASLTLYDLDAPRAAQLAGRIREGTDLEVRTGPIDPAICDLAINASPIGLHDTDPLPFEVDALVESAVVADVVMEPLMTQLLCVAEARGLRVHHGRHMMHFALPLAAGFYRLPQDVSWQVDGGAP